MVWNQLRGRRLDGVKFRRQFGLGPYIADFYSPKHRLVVEIDGDSHFTPAGQAYDAERTAYVHGLGLREIRFTNADVRHNLHEVIQSLRETIARYPSPYEGEGMGEVMHGVGEEPMT